MVSDANTLDSGLILQRYEVLHEIAAGGMASVYLGRVRGAAGFERLVAIKRCHPHLERDSEFAAMFLHEARLAAMIHHPNVVATIDVSDGTPLCLVMEYIDGWRLADLVRVAHARREHLPPRAVRRILVDVLTGLHAAHELRDASDTPLQLVHRDVAPQNVLVGNDGVARIADFGIAKSAAKGTVTRDGKTKGRLAYMPPEQLLSGIVSRRTDVYAAGVVLWEALAGERLFAAESEGETVTRVLNERVEPPSVHAPGISPALDAIVLRALSRDPSGRFPTAAAFAEALERVDDGAVSAREVASLITEHFADANAERRALLARVVQRGRNGRDAEAPLPTRAAPQLVAHGGSTHTEPTQIDRTPPPEATPATIAPRSPTRRFGIAVGVVLLALALAAGALRMRPAPAPATSVQSIPTSTPRGSRSPTASEVTAIAPPEPRAPLAPSPASTTSGPTAPTAATAPAPTAVAPSPDARGNASRRVRRHARARGSRSSGNRYDPPLP